MRFLSNIIKIMDSLLWVNSEIYVNRDLKTIILIHFSDHCLETCLPACEYAGNDLETVAIPTCTSVPCAILSAVCS